MTDLDANINSPDDLLAKHLTGEATPEEARQVIEWIHASPEHLHYFEQMRSLWTKSAAVDDAGTPREEEAWERFQQVLATQQAPRRVVPWRKFLQVAAAVAVIVAAGLILFSRLDSAHRTLMLSSGDQVRRITLPDGSRVTLNVGSSLTYPRNFGAKDRMVQLDGEGFFTIAPSSGQPFVVEAGKLKVTVLGTTFNISEKGPSPEVVVETGKVKVTAGSQSVFLGARESAVLSARGNELEKRSVRGSLYSYYSTGVFRCEATPLRALAAALSDAYHTPVVVPDSITGETPITTTFRYDQPLDSILAIISETLGVHMTKHRDTILIR